LGGAGGCNQSLLKYPWGEFDLWGII